MERSVCIPENEAILKEVMEAYDFPGTLVNIERYGHGHINDTFCVVCQLPEGTEMCMPGDNVEMTIELIHPVAMEQGLRFAIREGGRAVGSGVVVSINE